MSYKKVSSSLEGYINLTEPGTSIEGQVRRLIKEVSTKHGNADYLILEAKDTQEQVSLVLTANLTFIDWNKLIGKTVLITFEGHKPTKDKKHHYKSYEIMVDDDNDDDE